MTFSSQDILQKRDQVVVRDGSIAIIQDVLHAHQKTIYRLRFVEHSFEGYYEADKITLHRRHPLNTILRLFGLG